MTKRAFIIAIENYTQMLDSLAPSLPNTHKHAGEFRQWLIDVEGLKPAEIFFCTEDPNIPGHTHDATRSAIEMALSQFQTRFKDTTGDMFFYYSGHGFCYVDVDGKPVADILIGSDYVDRKISGSCCLKLDEIQTWLKICLGSDTTPEFSRCGHYHFIDACRNEIAQNKIKVPELSLTYDNASRKKKATVFALYSVNAGDTANVDSGFHDALLDGLNGKGRAKRWHEKTFAVLFDSLRGYLERRLGADIDPHIDGGGDGLIQDLGPNLQSTCNVRVINATAQDAFQMDVTQKSRPFQANEFNGPAITFPLPVDEYAVQVQLKNSGAEIIEPMAPLPADLYDDCTLEFRKAPKPPTPSGGVPRLGGPNLPPSLHILLPLGASVSMHGTDFTTTNVGAIQAMMVPGNYTLETRDLRGIVVDRRRVAVEYGENKIDLTKLHESPLRTALLRSIGGRHNFTAPDGTVEFSESIGPMPDQGLDLWLALIGAARIVGGNDDFSKLSPLPLDMIDIERADQSAFYLLAGFDNPDTQFRATIADDWQATAAPHSVDSHRDFPGLFQVTLQPVTPGTRYVTIQIDGHASTTFCTCLLPMRGTLITVSRGPDKDLRIQQFILPLKRFLHELPEEAGFWLAAGHFGPQDKLYNISAPLRLVRRCVEVQRAFAHGLDLDQILNREELELLLYFKWFEPVIAVMAAYELVRRGHQKSLPEVVGNLRHYFAGLPDTEALAKLAGLDWNMPTTPPLLLDGFQALNLMAELPRTPLGPPPGDTTVFRGPWTSWRGLATASAPDNEIKMEWIDETAEQLKRKLKIRLADELQPGEDQQYYR